MTQVKLLVTINLDPVPGWGQNASDFIEALKKGHGVGHYIADIVEVPPPRVDVCTEDNHLAILAGFKVGEPLRNNGHCPNCFLCNAVVPRIVPTCRSCGHTPNVQSNETSEPNTDPS